MGPEDVGQKASKLSLISCSTLTSGVAWHRWVLYQNLWGLLPALKPKWMNFTMQGGPVVRPSFDIADTVGSFAPDFDPKDSLGTKRRFKLTDGGFGSLSTSYWNYRREILL